MLSKRVRLGLSMLNSMRRGIIPLISKPDLFNHDLIVHFTYHKCLTLYFAQIMKSLTYEFHFKYFEINTDIDYFRHASRQEPGKRVIQVANINDIDLTKLPDYRGSHVVRDPRDLVVSGYYYHKRTIEKWCHNPDFDWSYIVENPIFQGHVESDPKKYPANISYQDYLNTLDKERGLILEILWRKNHFQHMRTWDYSNPKMIEVKYEAIIGAETDTFAKIFEHYKMHPKMIERGLNIVDRFSLKNKAIRKKGHIRSGKKQQWADEFSDDVKKVFEDLHGDLLLILGYEKEQTR
ncbi:MAG: hypothetical protein P9L92_12730 [Candidatus Electryonea clarkiae]|nr:hypothetical protein [Candidatus Electryonea clarkiae]